MDYKAMRMELKEINDREVGSLFAVFGHPDDGDDLIHPGAFVKTISERLDRIKALWQHDAFAPPIGVVTSLKEIGKEDLPTAFRARYPDATGGLYGKVRYLETDRGNEVFAGLKAGAITENSIGYDPIKFDIGQMIVDGEVQQCRNLRECRLWDVSPVNWGMNEAARVIQKSAVPYRDTGKAPEDEAWSAPNLGDFTEKGWNDLDNSEKRRIASHYAWAAELPPEKFGDLKLPHHRGSKSGTGPAVWRGVANAMARLNQASIPSGDVAAVRGHLEKHYKQFDKEIPDGKMFELYGILYEMLEHSGIVVASAGGAK